MDLPQAFDICVVGAGVPGTALALGCAQAGWRVALAGPTPVAHRPSPAAPYDSRIYALAPAAISLLEHLRVWPSIDASRCQGVARMEVFGDRGGRLDFDAWSAAVPQLALIAEESSLLQGLATAIRFAPVERYLAPFQAMAPENEAPVQAARSFADASIGTTRVQLADGQSLLAHLVVGADGAGSAVRTAAGIRAVEHSYGQTAVVANFATDRDPLAAARQWFCDQGIVALLPLPGRTVSLVWSAPAGLAAELLALAPDALARRVGERCGHLLGELRPLGAARGFPLRRVTVGSLIATRLALVGDAAHVVHPLAGQGLNLALQDVAELLAVLAQARQDPHWRRTPGDPVLLRRFQRVRAEPIAAMRTVTDGLARLFDAPGAGARTLRNLGLNGVARAAPLKHLLVRHAFG